MIERCEPVKVGASCIARVIQSAYEETLGRNTCTVKNSTRGQRKRALDKWTKRAEEAALKAAAECFGNGDGDVSKIEPEWRERFLKLARGEAVIVGWSHTGFTYIDDPDAQYVPALHDHGKPGLLAVFTLKVPTKEEIVQRMLEAWGKVSDVEPDANLMSVFNALAEHDGETWDRAEEIAQKLYAASSEPPPEPGTTIADAMRAASEAYDGTWLNDQGERCHIGVVKE